MTNEELAELEREARKAWLSGPAIVRDLETNSVTIGDHEAAIAVVQAYGDARADAARREAVDAARSAVFAILRKHDVDEQMFAEIAAATHALKENPNAG